MRNPTTADFGTEPQKFLFRLIWPFFWPAATLVPYIVTFHGETVDELEAAFKEAVEHYLATCAKLGDEPNKPYSGKLTLRLPPNFHAAIATAAEISGKSLNKWATDVLDQAAQIQ